MAPFTNLPSSSSSSISAEDVQKHCKLLRLIPPEIRSVIWCLAIESADVHMYWNGRRRYAWTCAEPLTPVSTKHEICDRNHQLAVPAWETRQMKPKLAPLVLTCRQCYAEGIDLYYMNTRFRLEPTIDLPFRLAESFGQSLQSIRHVVLKVEARGPMTCAVDSSPTGEKLDSMLQRWEETYQALLQLEGLADLHIHVCGVVARHLVRAESNPLALLGGLRISMEGLEVSLGPWGGRAPAQLSQYPFKVSLVN